MKKIDKIKQDLFVIQQLARRDKRRDNTSTSLGQIWQILTPFINMMILVVLFSTLFKADAFINYPLFVCSGTLFYSFFVEATNGCMSSLITNKQFLLKTTNSKNIYVLEKFYVSIINLFFSLCIYIGLMVYFKISFHFVNLLVLIDIILFSLFVLGVGKILAVIYVSFADIRYLYKIFTLFVFYGSAIFYKPERLSQRLQILLSLNPVYISVAIARQLLIDGIMPSFHLWIKMGVYGAIFYLLGTLIFEKGSENIVKNL